MPESGTGDTSQGGDAATPVVPFRCADHAAALFCADFESGAFNTGWDTIYVPNGGTLAFGAGRFGRGLVATVPTRAGTPTPSTRPNAAVEKGVSLAARAPLTLAFDVKIESGAGGAGVVEISGIDFHGPFYIVTFRMVDDGTIHLHEFGDTVGANPVIINDFPLIVQPAIGSWVHVAMQMTFPSASSARLVVLFDGATAYDGAIGAAPYASKPFVYAGISNAESAGQARTIDFDDILVTTP
jgi:hypothetical protein